MITLSTPQGDEPSKHEIEEVRDAIQSTVKSQLGSFPGGVRDLLIRELGEKRYEALVRDIANNVTQVLL